MVGFPSAVERFKTWSASSPAFDHENPIKMDHNALEPTSGRKLWKLRHGKRIKKPMKKDKSGFIGGSVE